MNLHLSWWIDGCFSRRLFALPIALNSRSTVLLWNNYISFIANDSGKIVDSLYLFGKYLTPSGMISLQESEPKKNGELKSDIGWTFRVRKCISWQSPKASTRACGWLFSNKQYFLSTDETSRTSRYSISLHVMHSCLNDLKFDQNV